MAVSKDGLQSICDTRYEVYDDKDFNILNVGCDRFSCNRSVGNVAEPMHWREQSG